MSQFEPNFYTNVGASGGGGGGGGYVQGGSPFSSPGGRARSEASQSLRPFTLAQLSKASQAHTDSEWRVDDIEVGQVTIVGEVTSIQHQATNHVYVIDDGTGSMEARQWIASEDGSNAKENSIGTKQFVRVVGGLKSFGKKRYVNVNHIRPASDPHEVYFHLLEAMTVSLIVERGAPVLTNSTAGPQRAPAKKSESSPYSTTATSTSATGNPIINVNSTEYAHLPLLHRRILEFITHQPYTDEGVNVAHIAKAVAGHDAHQISTALDDLMGEGSVYTTIDDSHFNISA